MADNEFSRFRKLEGLANIIWKITLGLIPIVGILYIIGLHYSLGISLYEAQYIGLFLSLMLVSIFLGVPISKRASISKLPWYDIVLAILGGIVGLYITIYYPKIAYSFNEITPLRLTLSVIAVLLLLESLRRMVGFVLVCVVVGFMLYAWTAPIYPGPLSGKQISLSNLFNYLYLDQSSMLNMIGIAATIALAFILFGQILLMFKGGDILNDISISLFGRFRGGPAKASVVGSSMIGSITGGPATNVMITGTITIPLMKQNGYKAVQAGAIEAVASTGGQIMPPVMGVAAFVIADYLGVPYAEVALAALIPAILYYFCLFVQVDFMAARKGLNRLPPDKIPSLKKILHNGWIIVPPFIYLIYTLFFLGFPPANAGIYASFVAIVFLMFQKECRKNFTKLLVDAFVGTGKTALEIGIILAAAGVIVGVVGVTGLGYNLGLTLTYIGEHGLVPLLISSAVISIILGMGMHSVAAYTIVAVLVAPSLIELGVVPIAAHLFVFYFAIISNFTPPIALACFAAAPLAQASATKIGFTAMRLGAVGYVVPFLFVFAPSMLLQANQQTNYVMFGLTVATAIIACFLLGSAFEGYLLRPLKPGLRIQLVIISILLFIPFKAQSYSWIANVLAILWILFIVFKEWQVVNQSKADTFLVENKEKI